MQLSFAFHDRQTTGSLMSRATADVEGIRMFMNMGAVRSVFIVVMLAGSAVGMLLLDVSLALVLWTLFLIGAGDRCGRIYSVNAAPYQTD